MRVEVLVGVERRRRWSQDDKVRIVEETRRSIHGRRRGRRRDRCDGDHARHVRDARPVHLNRGGAG
jgi:hypothetical protein